MVTIIGQQFRKSFFIFSIFLKKNKSYSSKQSTFNFTKSIADILCQSGQDAKKFKDDPSKYLKEITHRLKDKLIQRVTNQKIEEKECQDIETYKKIQSTQIEVKFIPYTEKIYKTFAQLNSDIIGNWIVITGTVIQALQKKALDKSKLFACTECRTTYRVRTSYENSYKFQMPSGCNKMVEKEKNKSFIGQLYSNMYKRKNEKEQKEVPLLKLQKCGNTKFDPIQKDKICIDYQQLRIQEQFQFISSGKIPQTITVILQGNISGINIFRPGDDLTITGILSYRYKKLMKDFKIMPQLILVANSVVVQKSGNYISDSNQRLDAVSETQMSKIYANFPLNYYSHFQLTSKQKVIIKQLQFRREIISSFCPSIYGRSMVKLGLLLSLLGGVSLQNQSTKIRGHSHVLLVGQPGTGKSVLLKQIAKLADRSFFTNGIGTTSAGLSVSYFKEGGDWMIEAGALVLADHGICCIDQLTLLSKKDEKSLLESMEQQTISSAKASVVGKLNARTTVICACNPIRPGQVYDEQFDLQANTGLSIPLLTRFDMIFIMKDEKDVSEDAQKCDHILEKFCESNRQNIRKSKSKVINTDKINLKALLKKCKSCCPQLQNNELLTVYYTQQRKRQSKVKTARAFQSLCRIAEAHAKLMLRQTTILLDYVTAICLTQNNYFSTIQEYYSILDNFNKKYGLNLL